MTLRTIIVDKCKPTGTAARQALLAHGEKVMFAMFDNFPLGESFTVAKAVKACRHDFPASLTSSRTRTDLIRMVLRYLIVEGEETGEPQVVRTGNSYHF